MTLYTHINTIHVKLAQLEKQIQTHFIYSHSQPDAVQLEAPDYNSDIDGNIEILKTYPKTESKTSIHTGGGMILSHFWTEIPLRLDN